MTANWSAYWRKPVPSMIQPAFWELERKRLWSEFVDLLMDTMLAGASNGLPLLPAALRPLVSWDVVNESALAFLRGYKSDILDAIDAVTEKQARQVVAEWSRSGAPLDVLRTQLAPIFGTARARAIAATEVTRMFAAGNQLLWQSTGVVEAKIWQTARDEMVCFPAWTMVTTKNGDVPIQNIKPGDLVLTREGYRRVIATRAKRYAGGMTTITAGSRQVTATSDHPIWESKQGWLHAGNFSAGNFVNLNSNEIAEVGSVVNFQVGNSNNAPSASVQKLSFSEIPRFIPMPVCAVNFDGNSVILQNEVNRIPPYFSLLNIVNPHSDKAHSDNSLNGRFAAKPPVASKGAKLPAVAGRIPELLPAIAAGNILGRASALLGTVMPIKASFGDKHIPAPLAGGIFGISEPTLDTTNGVSVGNTFFNKKWFTTFGANLLDHFSGPVGIVARSATPPLVTFDLFGRHVKLNAAMLAVNKLSTSLALRFSKFKFIVGSGHNSLLSKFNILYHKSFANGITVYDIQVEDVPEFYANGILVHNCPLCGPLHNQVVELSSNFTLTPTQLAQSPQMKAMLGKAYTPEKAIQRANGLLKGSGSFAPYPPYHPNCRCWIKPVVSLEMVEQRIGDVLAQRFFAELRAGKYPQVVVYA